MFKPLRVVFDIPQMGGQSRSLADPFLHFWVKGISKWMRKHERNCRFCRPVLLSANLGISWLRLCATSRNINQHHLFGVIIFGQLSGAVPSFRWTIGSGLLSRRIKTDGWRIDWILQRKMRKAQQCDVGRSGYDMGWHKKWLPTDLLPRLLPKCNGKGAWNFFPSEICILGKYE